MTTQGMQEKLEFGRVFRNSNTIIRTIFCIVWTIGKRV